MVEVKEQHWTYYLRPIWIGTGIGIALGLLVYVMGEVFHVEHTEYFAWMANPMGGSGGSYVSTSILPAILALWGFLAGFLVAIRRRVMRYKSQKA